jgi:hypothetical protein
VSVLLGKGDGTLANKVDYFVGGSAAAVTLGDLDGDHHLDIVATGDGVIVLLGKGDGTFPATLVYAASSSSLALGDVNGDGRPDVVVAAYSSSVAVLLNTTCR